MTETDVTKMSTSDNKNELQDRLQTALLDGDISLENTAIKDVLEEDVGILTEDEEKLLSDENELPTHEPLQVSTVLNATAKQNLISPAPTKKVILKRESLQIRELSCKERLELRAKRFGVQTNETAAAATGNPSKTSNVSILANNGNEETAEKQMQALKRRTERFGCVTSSKLAKLDASAMLLRRKERFGLAEGNTTTINTTTSVATETTTSSSGTTDIWAEKAHTRLERFKQSSTTTKTSTVQSI